MRRVLGVLVVGVALVAMSSGPAAARPWGGGPGFQGDGGGLPIMMLLRAVGLTDDQKAQVRQIVANHRPTFQSLRTQLKTAQEALRSQVLGGDPTAALDITKDPLASQVQQIEALRNQLFEEGLKVSLEIRAILTPDQLARAAQVREQVGQLRGQIRSLLGGR